MDSADLRKWKESVNLKTNREVSSSNNIEKNIEEKLPVSYLWGTSTYQHMYIGRSRRRKQSNRINI